VQLQEMRILTCFFLSLAAQLQRTWRKKDANLLCRKKRGSIFEPRSSTLRKIMYCPVEDHEMYG
jgi:hypothetical protein